MLWTICSFSLILWLLGLVSGYTMGGVIHALLVIAIIVVLVGLYRGEDPCSRLDLGGAGLLAVSCGGTFLPGRPPTPEATDFLEGGDEMSVVKIMESC